MKICLAAGPESVREAAETGLDVAVMGYRADKSGRLFIRQECRGGGTLLAVDAAQFDAPAGCGALAGALLSEVREKGYGGILLDLGGNRSAAGTNLARLLLAGLGTGRLYQAGGTFTEGVSTLVETGISRGTLAAHLRQAVARFGAERTVPDVQRLRREYRLPAGNGKGRDLSGEELRSRLEQFRPAVHFSRELCAHYFTWSRGRETFFVLFDDAASFRRKLHLAESMGMEQAFFFWPEVRDMIRSFLPPGRSF